MRTDETQSFQSWLVLDTPLESVSECSHGPSKSLRSDVSLVMCADSP